MNYKYGQSRNLLRIALRYPERVASCHVFARLRLERGLRSVFLPRHRPSETPWRRWLIPGQLFSGPITRPVSAAN